MNQYFSIFILREIGTQEGTWHQGITQYTLVKMDKHNYW